MKVHRPLTTSDPTVPSSRAACVSACAGSDVPPMPTATHFGMLGMQVTGEDLPDRSGSVSGENDVKQGKASLHMMRLKAAKGEPCSCCVDRQHALCEARVLPHLKEQKKCGAELSKTTTASGFLPVCPRTAQSEMSL